MKFASLSEALKFRKCPCCKSMLKIRDKSISSSSPEIKNGIIYFHLLSINKQTNEIKCLPPIERIIVQHFSLRLDCASCWQYQHDLYIEIEDNKLVSCTIDDIFIKRIINNCEFTLKNSKSSGKSILTKIQFQNPYPETEDMFEWNEETINLPKDIVLPYHDLNYKNPDETILKLDDLSFFI